MSDWPAWATEPVEVHPADPAWQQRGRAEAGRLDAALARWLTAPVEHVGSTAVPGLAAKPVLDLQAAVADLDCAEDVAAVLAPAGWHYVPPDLDGRPYRRFLVLVVDDRRAAHLHLLPTGSRTWRDQLAFRDALRSDPLLVQRYAALKRRLAAELAGDREGYTRAKAGFVAAALEAG